MKLHPVVFALFALIALADVADAQGRWSGESRSPGWEFGADVTYLLGSEIDFNGGSSIDVDDDVGLAMALGYRFNSRFELQFSLDYSSADYDANLQSATLPTLRTRVSGEVETFTAFGKAVFNVLEGPITPYVTGGIGWSFVDTNIPNGRVQVGCWWDPWYGQICTPYQSTKTVDELAYLVGGGVRWDASPTWTLRVSYEKQFVDFDFGSGTPDFDVFRIGLTVRY